MIGPACQFRPAAPPLGHTTEDASPISGVIPSLYEAQHACTVPQIVDAGSRMVRKSRFAMSARLKKNLQSNIGLGRVGLGASVEKVDPLVLGRGGLGLDIEVAW